MFEELLVFFCIKLVYLNSTDADGKRDMLSSGGRKHIFLDGPWGIVGQGAEIPSKRQEEDKNMWKLMALFFFYILS